MNNKLFYAEFLQIRADTQLLLRNIPVPRFPWLCTVFYAHILLFTKTLTGSTAHQKSALFLASRCEPSTMIVLKKLVSRMTENTVL